MTARSVVQSSTGTILAISANIPATYDSSGYAGSNQIYTNIAEIEIIGNHGVSRQIIEFTPVDTGIVAKMSGSKNYGTMDSAMGNVPGDAGQLILKAASESNNHYSLRITYPLGTGEVTPEIHYVDVIVGKFEYQDGAANDVQKVGVTFNLSRAPVVVAAS